jgi:hypothetical protein
MLYLETAEFPHDHQQLEQALAAAMRKLFVLPASGRLVEIESVAYPDLRRLRIDLSGAELHLDEPLPQPQNVAFTDQTVRAEEFAFLGRPLRHGGADVNASISARAAQFRYGRDARAQAWLMLIDATDGHASVHIGRQDLEKLILTAASAAAAKQGIRVESVRLDLYSRGDRSIEVSAQIAAAKFFAKSVIQITGPLDIDDELNARASSLTCRGEGMIGGIACRFLQPHLDRLSDRPLPLMALSMGQVRLRDVRIDVHDGLAIEARFGGSGV